MKQLSRRSLTPFVLGWSDYNSVVWRLTFLLVVYEVIVKMKGLPLRDSGLEVKSIVSPLLLELRRRLDRWLLKVKLLMINRSLSDIAFPLY